MTKLKQGQIGFIHGVLFAATLMAENDTNAGSILEEAGITIEDIKKYGEYDTMKVLENYLHLLDVK